MIALLMALFGAPEMPLADTPAAPEAGLRSPMRFVIVRGNDRACQPYCPQWLSAEGTIEYGTAALFSQTLSVLGARRLPILINSPGGSVKDAMEIGRLIRAEGLAVVVAHTILDPCSPSATSCVETPGAAQAAGALCGSACPLLLAGGVERYASPVGLIGVHQPTEVLTRTQVSRRYKVLYRVVGDQRQEISRTLVDENRSEETVKQAAGEELESDIGAYLREMGIGSRIAELIRATPPDGARWLDATEKATSGLVTIWIDQRSALVNGPGANGLAGQPVDPASGHGARIVGSTSVPLVPELPGEPLAFDANFVFLRGGGIVEASFSIRDAAGEIVADTRGAGYTLTMNPGNTSFRVAMSPSGTPARVGLPRGAFCKLSDHGRILVRSHQGPTAELTGTADATPSAPPLMTLDLGAGAGMRRLFAEACGS